jgi:6-pyruvoyltetrahydropterin 2'-reductase
MPTTLIQQKPTFTKKVKGEDKLLISEMFADTIQGEGIHSGCVSTFIRLQGCTLKCVWCDTIDVWPEGNEYSFDEIFEMFESINLINKFKQGQHLIITGGSPLKQEKQLINFINSFIKKYNFKPYIEVENEVVLFPTPEFVSLINWWNNSPKLNNSGMKYKTRIKPLVLSYMGSLPNSTFKFVISSENDWNEIKEVFIDTNFINKNQILLMPEGQTQEELNKNRELTVELAIKEGVRFCDRLHITIWNKRVGI